METADQMLGKTEYVHGCVTGFVVGVFVRSFEEFDTNVLIFLCIIGGIFLVLAWSIPSGKRVYLIAVIFILSINVGILRYEIKDLSDQVHSQIVPETKTFRVIDEPDHRDTYVRLTLKSDEIAGRVLVTTGLFPGYRYGDVLSITGDFKRPGEDRISVSEDFFDWPAYLAKDEIYYEVVYPEIEIIAHEEGNILRQKLFALKHAFLDRLARVIPEPQASFAGGLIVGAKQSMSKELLEDFRRVGLIHIVVLSGFNIAVIAIAIRKVFERFLPYRVGVIAALVSIALFAILVGGGPTVIRASIMAALALMATLVERTSDVTRALVIAGVIMLFINPKILVYDAGFQLSFIATLGMIYITPVVYRKLTFLPHDKHGAWFPFRTIVSATVGAQIAVLPWILYLFGELSLVALLANMLVLPAIPTTMLFGFLTGMAGFVSSSLSLPFAWIAHFLLTYELTVVKILSNIPFAAVSIGKLSFAITCAMYVLLLWLVYANSKKSRATGGRSE